MNQTQHLHHQYPAAMVNITNRCTLICKHCFIYGEFVTPFCCQGNDVDCDLCGSWIVFHLTARPESEKS